MLVKGKRFRDKINAYKPIGPVMVSSMHVPVMRVVGGRGVTMWAWRGGASIVGALAIYVSYLVLVRANYFQKRHIRKRLNAPKQLESKASGSGLWVARKDTWLLPLHFTSSL